jgi:hypothetical protein
VSEETRTETGAEPETKDKAEPEAAAWDPRPPSQVEAEEGARDGGGEADPRLRARDVASARAYAKDGIMGAPGSELGWEGDPPEPYPVTGVRPPSQIEAEDGPDQGTDEPQDKTGKQ